MAAVKTPREEQAVPMCGARKKNGDRCRNHAGAGTDHKGIGKCGYHGGHSPSHRKHAALVEAERKVGELGTAIPVSPAQLMKACVDLTAGSLTWAMRLVAEVGDDEVDEPRGRMRSRVFAEERERAARIAKMAADLGVDERLASLAEHQTAMVAQVFEAVADEIELTKEQRQALGPAVRRQLASMQNGSPEVIEGSAA
jgi:hypothetical protein